MYKILHICLSGQYIDGWGYQENLLPAYLSAHNTENIVIASENSFPAYVKKDKIEEIRQKGNDYYYNNVRILRVKTYNPTSALAFAPGLYGLICKVNPDVIFHHDVIFSTLSTVRRYLRRHKAVLMIDNHADEWNVSKNKLWNFCFHNIANRMACRMLLEKTRVFYGVSPARCEFMNKFYGVPLDKICLLPIGADSVKASGISPRSDLRKKYGFRDDEKIIVSGGKMGIDKGTDSLVRSVEGTKFRLVLFGAFGDEYTRELAGKSSSVTLFGWCDRQTTLELLKLADVACWPVHHTTLIEDAVSVGTPLLLRKSGNVSHLMMGNGRWTCTETLRDDISRFFDMDAGELARNAGMVKDKIDYCNIAEQVIHDIDV